MPNTIPSLLGGGFPAGSGIGAGDAPRIQVPGGTLPTVAAPEGYTWQYEATFRRFPPVDQYKQVKAPQLGEVIEVPVIGRPPLPLEGTAWKKLKETDTGTTYELVASAAPVDAAGSDVFVAPE